MPSIEKAHLNGICLDRVVFTNARLDGSHLVNCRFSESDLSKAFLRHADMRGDVLSGSVLANARLDNANLEGADLWETLLEGTFFMKVNLKSCKLDGIPSRDAQSRNVDFSGSQGNKSVTLEQAILIETILPDGRKATNNKGKEYLRKKEYASLVDKL